MVIFARGWLKPHCMRLSGVVWQTFPEIASQFFDMKGLHAKVVFGEFDAINEQLYLLPQKIKRHSIYSLLNKD